MTLYVDDYRLKRSLIRSGVYFLVRDDEPVAVVDEEVVIE